MMKIGNSKFLALTIFSPLIFFLPLPSSAFGKMGGQGMGMMGGSSERHTYFMRHGLDSKYANMKNPLPSSVENIKTGKLLYEQKCVFCHGATGRGDGEAGKSLNPPPADLASFVRMPMASDGYFFWTITEGGAAFNSAMPAMKDSMKESDIWKLVLYLRSF